MRFQRDVCMQYMYTMRSCYFRVRGVRKAGTSGTYTVSCSSFKKNYKNTKGFPTNPDSHINIQIKLNLRNIIKV